MKMTQDNFDKLCDLMNHNVTDIKEGMMEIRIDVRWLKRLYWSMIGLLGTIGGALLAIAYKL